MKKERVYERSDNYRQQFFKENKPLFGKDIYQCAYCGHLHRKKKITVDHVIPINKVRHKGIGRILMKICKIDDINSTKNLVAACAKCNRKKTDKMGLWTIRGVIGKHFAFWVVWWIILLVLACVIFVCLAPYLSKFFELVKESSQHVGAEKTVA